MSIKIKGLDKLGDKLKSAILEVPSIAAIEYRKEVIKNLQPSRKSGALIKSLKIRHGISSATIYSDLPYAAIQNYGGKITITEKMRKKMWALWYEFKMDIYKAIALTKKSYVTIKGKHYLTVNNTKLMKKVDVELSKITKKI